MTHGRHRLYITGECRAAHTHKTRFPDHVKDGIVIISVQRIVAAGHFHCLIRKIVLNDHGHHHAAAGMGAGFHRNDLTGHGCMNRNTQALTVAHLGTTQHPVTHLHQGGTRRADMLHHRNHYLLGSDDFKEGDAGRHLFVILGVDTAKKQAFHSFTSLSINFAACFQSQLSYTLFRRQQPTAHPRRIAAPIFLPAPGPSGTNRWTAHLPNPNYRTRC